ncbi:MAG: Crp/Fnr family transcriptional regulator, partial [Chloroflexota bacterium]
PADVQYKAGEAIYNVGDPDEVVYDVKSGEVDLMFNGPPLEAVEVGGILGEKSRIDDHPHTTGAVARTDCEIVHVRVDADRFLFLIHETPMFALSVMRTLARRTRRVMRLAME